MDWTERFYVSNIARACYFELRCLASIRRFLTSTATATLVSAFALSRIDYCSLLLFGSTHDVTSHLQRIQNYAARVILCLPMSSSITIHLKSLHWLPVKVRSTYKIACDSEFRPYCRICMIVREICITACQSHEGSLYITDLYLYILYICMCVSDSSQNSEYQSVLFTSNDGNVIIELNADSQHPVNILGLINVSSVFHIEPGFDGSYLWMLVMDKGIDRDVRLPFALCLLHCMSIHY